MKLKIILGGLSILFGSLISCQQTEKVVTKIDTVKSVITKYDTIVKNDTVQVDIPSTQDQVRAKLIGTWKIQSVSVDATDITSDYSNMTLTFTSITYTTTNGLSVWSANGIWVFNDDTATAIVRNDGVVMNLVTNGSMLQLSFPWTGTSAGNYIFNFTK